MEIYDLIDSHYSRERQKIKQEVSQRFMQAEITAEFVHKYIIGGDATPAKPWDYYPELFLEEKCEYEKEKKQATIAKASESRREYAAEFNRRRRQG